MSEYAITVTNVNRTFRLPHERHDTVKERFFNFFRLPECEIVYAARDLSFSIAKGEFVGIIGDNGAGKSTLLKLLAGIFIPDDGDIKVNGRIAPFIELDVGFQPELSGRDNVFLYGALLGLTRTEVKDRYDDIVLFAEMERFMDQKVKNYSTGMKLRLGFAVTAHVDADLIFVDEALAVGDIAFQAKCYDRIKQLKPEDKTLLLVSHDLNQLQSICNRVIWIEGGVVKAQGDSSSVLEKYASHKEQMA